MSSLFTRGVRVCNPEMACIVGTPFQAHQYWLAGDFPTGLYDCDIRSKICKPEMA